MRAAAAELCAVLEREAKLARELVEILQQDQQRLVRHDVPGLEQSTLSKEEIVLRFQALEQERRAATRRLAADLGLGAEDVRVAALCARLGAEGAELSQSAEKLRAVIGSLRELVALGRGFLEQSILGIHGLLALIHSLRTPAPEATQTYDARGRIAPRETSEPVALRREI